MKVVAITGGGQGIGRATAFHFAKAGYAVSIADTNAAAGREAVKILREAGRPRSSCVPMYQTRRKWRPGFSTRYANLAVPTCWSTTPDFPATGHSSV